MARPSKIVSTPQPEDSDDVKALCSVAELNAIGYKRFTKPKPLESPVEDSTPPAGMEGSEQGGGAEDWSNAPVRPVALPPGSPTLLLGPDPFPFRSPATRRFSAVASPAMQAALPLEAMEESRRNSEVHGRNPRLAVDRIDQRPKSSANSPQSTRVRQLIPFYSGGGGGVGVTTIMATLARYLSAHGDNILLIDGSPHSMLGFFFNGTASPEGVSSFAAEALTTDESDGPGRVDICCRPAARSDNPLRQDADAWAMQSIGELGDQADRVFVDIGLGESGGSPLCLLAEGNPLVIIAPDSRCLPGVSRLMKRFTAQERSLGRFLAPSFLLNRFDPGVPFQLDILNRLEALLGDRILPIYIPSSDEISEIAAQGMTIMDFNPASDAAQSFRLLAEWIRTSRRASLTAVSPHSSPGDPCALY